MRVTVQYFDGCPNWQDTHELVRAALARLGQPDSALKL
jgi:hypothetical protein